MIRQLIESIAAALGGEFGEDYTVYDESIEQGLKEPCFFVQCLESTYARYRGKRYHRAQFFCIQYFPRDRVNARTECEKAVERIYGALELLSLLDEDVQLWGRGMRHEIRDNVLHFFVNYDLFILKREDETFMETLKQNMREKKGVKTYGSKSESG